MARVLNEVREAVLAKMTPVKKVKVTAKVEVAGKITSKIKK